MKYRHLLPLLSVFIPVSFVAAAPVVMVQFGSFETNDEAQKRLTTIKSSHADVLGALPASVREVKLPPDNLTVYRTQAGPFASRTDAQSLCAKLATSGDECYVVETAVPGVAVAPSGAASTLVATNETKTTVEPSPVTGLPSTTTTVQSTTSTLPSTASLANANARPATSSSVINTTTTTPVPAMDMQTSLDTAAATQNDAMATPVIVPVSSDKPGFWSRMNPFNDGAKAKPAAVAIPLPVANPDVIPAAEPVTATNTLPAAATLTTAEYTAPNPSSMIVIPPSAIAPEAAPRLLPPPPPLTAQDKKMLAANGFTAPATTAPVSLGNVPSPATSFSPVPLNDNGTVRVEEAKHVPLSEAMYNTVVATPTPAQMPSASLGQRTLWAQIGQFKDVSTALAFWESYRQMHPDFPASRVRVASSLQQQYHGNDKMWLRVGPFASQGFIHTLCSSVSPQQNDKNVAAQYGPLRCGVITDLGVAGSASATKGYLSGSRYAR